jgi:lactate 2-monooxygenase
MLGSVISRYEIIPVSWTKRLIIYHFQITIFGVTHPAPIFVAPIGAQGLMHNDGELATARAAAKVGVPLIVSSVASRSMEDVAQAHGPNGHRWYQLYW